MAVEILTKEDLQEFRLQLLEDLKQLVEQAAHKEEKRWLKGSEVRKLLCISAGTLQNLRVTCQLHFTKIGGTLYYRYEEIEQLLERGNKK